MRKHRRVATAIVAAVLWVCGGACAQGAAPKAEAETESAAAMQRAQRAATNPMRLILEAARLRSVVATTTAPPAAKTVAVVAAATAPASAAAAPPPAVQTAAPAPAPLVLVTDSEIAARQAAPVAALATGQFTAAKTTDLPSAALPSATLAEVVVAPKLTRSVDPNVTPAQLLELVRYGEVQAELLIRADGTVAQVKLANPLPRALQRPIVSAMEQWRFEPLPQQLTHRVQMVFTE